VATQADVGRIAPSLPGTSEARTDFAFGVEVKGKHVGRTTEEIVQARGDWQAERRFGDVRPEDQSRSLWAR
jgi:hypothetical protein